MSSLPFNLPYLLLLLPVALLPWIPRHRDTVAYPWLNWLPHDPVGRWAHLLWCLLATLCIASLILGLAGPHRSQTHIEKVGRGAELLVLLDRSASMDAHVRIVERKVGELARTNQSKNQVVRQALDWVIQERPENRYALTLFNVVPIHAAPFTDDSAMIRAALTASGIGRGPNKTNMGRALLSAIARYDERSFTGSRAILLVSDGGAKLDADTRKLIKEGLERNNISLYFIYIQSSDNSPDLETVGFDANPEVEEVALHLFFQGLSTDYRVYQANDSESMTKAVMQIDQQQNLPLVYTEVLPQTDYSHWFYRIALAGCLLLLFVNALRLETFR